jgi:hypothetical protein
MIGLELPPDPRGLVESLSWSALAKPRARRKLMFERNSLGRYPLTSRACARCSVRALSPKTFWTPVASALAPSSTA